MYSTQDVLTFGVVAPLFDQGAHHPTVLVVLQAITSLLGEVRGFDLRVCILCVVYQ